MNRERIIKDAELYIHFDIGCDCCTDRRKIDHLVNIIQDLLKLLKKEDKE